MPKHDKEITVREHFTFSTDELEALVHAYMQTRMTFKDWSIDTKWTTSGSPELEVVVTYPFPEQQEHSKVPEREYVYKYKCMCGAHFASNQELNDHLNTSLGAPHVR